MDRTRVLELLRLYSGEEAGSGGEARDALCERLCGDCAGWAERRAREDRPGDQEMAPALEALAAAEAFYQLALADEALGIKSLSAPELKLELGRRAENARLLAEEKRRACADVLQEAGFYFGRA